jgi:hypothetical protein
MHGDSIELYVNPEFLPCCRIGKHQTPFFSFYYRIKEDAQNTQTRHVRIGMANTKLGTSCWGLLSEPKIGIL